MSDLNQEFYIKLIGEGEVINFPSKAAHQKKKTGPDWAAYDRMATKYGIKPKVSSKPARKSSMDKWGYKKNVNPKFISWNELRHGSGDSKNEETNLFSDTELAYLESKLSEFDNK